MRAADVDRLKHWVEHGYVVMPAAVPAEDCEAIKADLRRAFEHGDDRLHVIKPGEHFGVPLQPGTPQARMRVNDIYVYYESARRALFAEPIVRFLRLIFSGNPTLLQSLTFDKGSQQGIHQDTAYVVIDPPGALAASWIALEDVQPAPASSSTTTAAIGWTTSCSAGGTSAGITSATAPSSTTSTPEGSRRGPRRRARAQAPARQAGRRPHLVG